MTADDGRESGQEAVARTWSTRPEARKDHEGIAAVVETAFRSSAHARLVEAIRSSPGYLSELSLVVEHDGQVVGHVMVSIVGLRLGAVERPIATLSPLAVAPAMQRRGIGQALVRAVVAAADARGEPLLVLEGDPRYYGRFGFEPATSHGIEVALPSWAPPEAAQVLPLRNHDASLTGRVVYPPAFEAVPHT